VRTFGVEEELLLVDAATSYPVALADQVSQDPSDEGPVHELQREQVETETAPCTTLDELADQLAGRRAVAARAARRTGAEVVALATSPLPVQPSVTVDDRYLKMAELYAMTAEEQLTCGCHVHVSVESEDEGVAVLDRIRPWLPALLAVSANSPFWQGRDSKYSSYRRQVWGRWPSAGPTGLFGTPKAYQETIGTMVGTGALVDEGMVYFDARLSQKFPTVEVRVADVCLRAADAVLLAALTRALVETAACEWRQGLPPRPVRTEVLHLAVWRASRSGLGGDLIHPVTDRSVPAAAVVGALADHVGPALAGSGDEKATAELLNGLLTRGNGAAWQRQTHARTGDLAEVVRGAVAQTLAAG
jgi:YbdK family carboxylate-amine ligase